MTSSNIVNAMTWDAHNVVVVPKEQLRSVVTEIEAYVDQFTADWTAVH